MGGTGPNAWDCSGLVQAAFKQVGVDLPRVSQDQSTAGTQVSLHNLQLGDILYWGGAGSRVPRGVYVGDGQYLDARQPQSKGVVDPGPVRLPGERRGARALTRVPAVLGAVRVHRARMPHAPTGSTAVAAAVRPRRSGGLREAGGGPRASGAARSSGLGHAFGATLLRPLMMRSIASPPVGSVRLASIFRVNFISSGWVRPRWAAIFMTFGLPMSFTKARPSV